MTLEKLVSQACDIQVVPVAGQKAMKLIDSDGSSAAQLSDVISRDQSLAAHILKVANSALYGLSREVTNLQMAISALGHRVIRDQVLVATTRGVYKRFGITEKMLWSHSVSSAIGSKLIAQRYRPACKEDAFICGLLHDVGKVILNNECPELFGEVMMKTYNEGYTFIQAEREVLGYTHTQVGAFVTRKWNYPNLIIETILHHHSDEEPVPNLEDADILNVLSCVDLANTSCKILGAGYRQADTEVRLDARPSFAFMKIPEADQDSLVAEINQAFEEESAGWA